MDMPKFHCRRHSGMNFGYVTETEVNSNACYDRRKSSDNILAIDIQIGMVYNKFRKKQDK